MTLMFTDLDNTVIYSHRHDLSDSRVWVEDLYGRHQSYMTEKCYSFYKNQDWLNVIPVTTRTPEQCGRLKKMTENLGWSTVLLCNGSVLLQNGIEDKAWTKESLCISRPDRQAFTEIYHQVQGVTDKNSVISTGALMFYVKSADADGMYSFLLENADLNHVCVHRDSRKVYCFPRALNKGSAVKRYMKKIGQNHCIAAGDSGFDVPMLNAADISFCPEGIRGLLNEAGIRISCSGIFSDQICENLNHMRKEDLF